MSWSASGVGKAGVLAGKLALEFDRVKCAEPEQTIKDQVAQIVQLALSAFPPDMPVRVNASGSQQSVDFSDPNAPKVNQLNVTIEPIWGFLE